MKSKTLHAGIFAGMISAVAIPAGLAQLPSFENNKVWNSFYFAGYQTRGADIGLDVDAKIDILPIGKNRERMTTQYTMPMLYVIEDVAADGKVKEIKIDYDTLVSPTTKEPTAKPDKIVVTGKVEEGDTTFELYYEVGRGSVLVGGKILEKGSLNNPRVVVTVKFPEVYKNAAQTDEKAFKRRIKDDYFLVRTVDGKRVKVAADEEIDITSEEFTGTGFSQVEVKIDEIGAREFTFTAAPGSRITAKNKAGQPFYQGLNLRWEGDPEGTTRFAVSAK